MRSHLLKVVVLLVCTGTTAAAAEAVTIRCHVREAKQEVASARAFPVPQKQADVGSNFAARATLSDVPRGQRADVVITDTKGVEREIVVESRLVLSGHFTSVFVTDGRGPQKLGQSGSAKYRSPLALPAVTFYGPEGGVTVAAPFEVRAPTLSFSWQRNGKATEVTVQVANLRLTAGGEAAVGLVVGRHEGCWRPGLGWLVDLYPTYFHPPNAKVFDFDGPMIYDFVTSESRLRRDLDQGLAWQELGWYWPHLGLYKPEAETWKRQPRSEGGLGEGGVVTRKLLNDYIALANRLGVGQCLYFQSTESWGDFAERRFPESRVRRGDGTLCPTWVKCVLMDPNPDGPFGKHILDQAQRLVESFPGMVGVFWDQNAYTGFDWAHDDGISMVGGRRVSMLEFPQNRMLAMASKFLHENGKVIFTNGGWTAGLARYCDGHMSEGTGPTRRLQYICMSKHLTLLCYDGTLTRGKEKLALALETGAQPSVTLGDDACRELFARYRPIFRMLRRKQWVFHPKAYDPPAGLRGNIFRTGEGNYLATLVADPANPPSPIQQAEHLSIPIRLSDASEVRSVLAWRPDYRGFRMAAVRKTSDGFVVDTDRPDPCSATVLARRRRWLAADPPHLIAGLQTPVHIVLANLTETPWVGQWHVDALGSVRKHALHVEPFATERISLGSLAIPTDTQKLTISIRGPGTDNKTAESIVDIPVRTAIDVRVPTDTVVQRLRGKDVAFVVANRLSEDLAVDVEVTWRQKETRTHTTKLTLTPRETRSMTATADVPHGGLWTLGVLASWPGGRMQREVKVDVFERNLAKDFRIEDAEQLTLRMDVFNSLGEEYADKPVTVNGIVAGRLPITGQTLKWHEGLEIQVTGEIAHQILRKGVAKTGDIELRPTVANTVRNCFKVRNVQAAIQTRSGETFVSTWTRTVRCTGAGWLYSEGDCVHFGHPVPLGPLRFLRKRGRVS